MNDQAQEGRSRARPFTMTQTVKWGDCDPAGIIYTPRILDFAMETLEAWYRDVLGTAWLKLNMELGMAAPTVRAEIDFLAAPAPDQVLATEIRVKALGRSSITFALTGRGPDGTDYYRVQLVACFVQRPAFTAMPVPENFRQVILAYQRDCGDA